MCDILCTADDIPSTLSQEPEYLWCHIHFRHCTHWIFLITTSSLISPPLLNDITPTLSVTSYPLYISSHPILKSSHYSTYDITTSKYETTSSTEATYTLYMRHHSRYLCSHTHCIDNITPTLCMISHSPYVWHRLNYRTHCILILSPQTSVFMSSYPLYLSSCPLYLCHHIHCIDDITPTVFLRSHLL